MFRSTTLNLISLHLTFQVCDSRYSELIPCLDQSLQKQLKMRLNHSLMEHFERHCPPPQQRLNCLIPPPPNYQVCISTTPALTGLLDPSAYSSHVTCQFSPQVPGCPMSNVVSQGKGFSLHAALSGRCFFLEKFSNLSCVTPHP